MLNKINDCYITGDRVHFKLQFSPSNYSISSGQENIEVNLYKYGNTIIDTRPALKSISFSSFFSDKNYSFKRDKYIDKWKCINNIELLKKSKQHIKVMITNTEIGTDKDFICFIEDFNYNTTPSGDIEYSINFKEARHI